MANRHSHKKLRAAARARMARTGESYQQARQTLLALTSSSASAQACSGFDQLEFRYLGKPAVLLSWHSYGVPVVIVLSEAVRRPFMFPRFALRSSTGPLPAGSK